jgi:putative hydrolase of the HAD superfamily
MSEPQIEVIVSDFGGVLTSPLMHSFAAFQDRSGVPLEALGKAMARTAEIEGAHPLFELEKGALSEADFLVKLGEGLHAELGREVELHGFGEMYFDNLHPNEPMIEYVRGLRERGYRAAILTNNVREWEPLWRRMLPVDEIFELVVDSAFVGMRKPDPAIYELTLEQLGIRASAALFIDDLEINCDAARELGMSAVHFRETDQTIADVEAILDDGRGT